MKYTIAVFIVLFCTGCIYGTKSEAGGPKAKRMEKRTEFDKDGVPMAEVIVETYAEGPTFTGEGTKSWTPPSMKVDSDGIEIGNSGGTFFDVASIKATATNMRFLYMIGGLAILGGAVLGFFVNWKLGAALAAGGGVLIGLTSMVSAYPWILAIPLIMLTAACIWVVIDMRRGERNTSALTTLVKVANDNEDIKNDIAMHPGSDKTFRKTIRTVKQNNGI